MNRLQAAEKRYANLKFLWEKEKKKNADLLQALEDVLAHYRYAHEHDCAGWECAECYPQIMAGKVEQAIAKAEGASNG
jgi:hypothetical protein